MVELLPYNWQWAGICELYRNIRCIAALLKALLPCGLLFCLPAGQCSFDGLRGYLSNFFGVNFGMRSRSVGDIHHVAWRANSMQWAAYASPNDEIYGSWTAAECGST